MSTQRDTGRWPFAGRRESLVAARAALEAGTGAVVAGQAGAGKSRLASEVVAGLTGYAVVQVVATQAAAGLPFGAFAHVVDGQPAGSGNLLRAAARRVRAAAEPDQPLLVVVDDAHLLDAASAALVHHLVLHDGVAVLATVRDGEPAPDPVIALWKDHWLPRIALAPLTVDEAAAVLTGALGGQVETGTVSHLVRVSEGNLLYLRELVLAGRENGTLCDVDGVWCWRGELSLTGRLRDLIGARVGHLDPDVREVLELVAHGEPLGASLLAGLTSAGAVERAEERGLVTTTAEGRRWQVRLAHPLYGEAVRRQCGSWRARRQRQQLAEAVAATGLRRREDVLRVAVWRLDSQSPADPQLLLAAAGLARNRHDPPLAARLARAAVDAGGGLAATTVLGEMLMALGRMTEAVAVLRDAGNTNGGATGTGPGGPGAGDRATDRERVRHAAALGISLAWTGADDQACAVLDTAAAAVADPHCRQEVLVERAWVDFFAGRLGESAELLARARDLAPASARVAAHAAALQARVSAHRGQSGRSLAVVEAALADATGWQDQAYALPTLLEAQCLAYAFAGDLAAAGQAVDTALAMVEGPGRADVSVSCFGAHRAMVHRLHGQVAEALRRARQDTVRLRERTPYLGRCLGELAHAAALAGEVATARQALAEAEPLVRCCAYTHLPVLLSRAWVAAADGDLDAAVREAIAAAEAADKRGMAGYLMFALHDVVRLGGAPLVADRLAALAGQMDGPLVALCARHATAAVAADGAELRAVSTGFEERGLVLHAAEAAAQAAGAFRAVGRQASARGAETRAWELAGRCPGVRTPALTRLAAPELTARQREIAQLAVAGLSNRQIAERLTLSLRTVANHLQAAYTEVGVHNRAALGRVLRHLSTAD